MSMDTCDHEVDHNCIVVLDTRWDCGVCELVKALEEANDRIAELEAEVVVLEAAA